MNGIVESRRPCIFFVFGIVPTALSRAGTKRDLRSRKYLKKLWHIQIQLILLDLVGENASDQSISIIYSLNLAKPNSFEINHPTSHLYDAVT